MDNIFDDYDPLLEEPATGDDAIRIVGIPWYSEESWTQLKAAGAIGLDESFSDWSKSAWRAYLNFHSEGATALQIPLELEHFLHWCSDNGMQLDSKARSRFIAEQAAALSEPAGLIKRPPALPTTIGEAVNAIIDPFNEHKREAVKLLQNTKEKAVTHIANVVDCLLNNYRDDAFLGLDYPPDVSTLFILLGVWGDARHHELIIKLAAMRDDMADDLLSDLVTERLSAAMYRTYNGDPGVLLGLFNNQLVFEWSRAAAADALTRLALEGKVERKLVVSAFEQSLNPHSAAAGSSIWSMVVGHLGDLHATESLEFIKAAFDLGLPSDEVDFEESFVKEQLELSAQRCAEDYLKHFSDFYSDIFEELEFWKAFDHEELPRSKYENERERLAQLRKARRKLKR